MIKLFENNKQCCFLLLYVMMGVYVLITTTVQCSNPKNDGQIKKHISKRTKIELCGNAKELIKIFYHQFKCIYFELNIVCILSYLLKKKMKSLALFHHLPCLFINTVSGFL